MRDDGPDIDTWLSGKFIAGKREDESQLEIAEDKDRIWKPS
jgi:hypothetical protein